MNKSMYPELSRLINNIQRSNLMENKELVCKAVQEYYKLLNQNGAIKNTIIEQGKETQKGRVIIPKEPEPVAPVVEAPVEKVPVIEHKEEIPVETIEELPAQVEAIAETKPKRKPLIKMTKNELVAAIGNKADLRGDEANKELRNILKGVDESFRK